MADETQDSDFEETVKEVGKGCVVLGTDGCAGCLSLVVLALAVGAWGVTTLVGLLF